MFQSWSIFWCNNHQCQEYHFIKHAAQNVRSMFRKGHFRNRGNSIWILNHISSFIYEIKYSNCNFSKPHTVDETMGIAFGVTRRQSHTNFLILWFLTIFLPLLPQCSPRLRCESPIDAPTGTGLHNTVFWLAVVFCSGLNLLQREVASWGTSIKSHQHDCPNGSWARDKSNWKEKSPCRPNYTQRPIGNRRKLGMEEVVSPRE